MSNLSPSLEKRLLQIVVAVACLVPLVGGGWGVWHGVGVDGQRNVDSHYHYLSGLLLGIGLCFAASIPHVERHAARFRLLTFIVVVGGLARLAGVVIAGVPSQAMLMALVMEVVVTPLLCLWQNRVARRYVRT